MKKALLIISILFIIGLSGVGYKSWQERTFMQNPFNTNTTHNENVKPIYNNPPKENPKTIITPKPVTSTSKASCEANKGTWSVEYKECLGVDENICKAIGGTYNGCASACRHDPNAEMCTMNCVQVCTVE